MSSLKENIGVVEKAYFNIYDSRDMVKATTVERPGEVAGGLESFTQRITREAIRTYAVKFNPSTLSFAVKEAEKRSKNNYDDQQTQIEDEEPNQQVTVSMQLIFDDYCYEEAFMSSAMDYSVTTVGKKLAMEKLGFGNEKHTVQYQVEAFMEALRNPYLRKVRFSWGKLSYMGILSKVNATYTMFSTEGRPLRATVDVSIQCEDKGICAGELGPWTKQYNNTFVDGGTDEIKMKNTSTAKGKDMSAKLENFKNVINIMNM